MSNKQWYLTGSLHRAAGPTCMFTGGWESRGREEYIEAKNAYDNMMYLIKVEGRVTDPVGLERVTREYLRSKYLYQFLCGVVTESPSDL